MSALPNFVKVCTLENKQTNNKDKKTPPNEPPYGLLLIFFHSLKLSFSNQYILNSLKYLFAIKVRIAYIQFSGSTRALLCGLFNTI